MGSSELEEDRSAYRGFVVALGGFVLDTAGGSLVTHERISVPSFNYVDLDELAADRMAGLFERALDHYFQRAIRPTFRAARPVPAHVDRALRGVGFAPAPDPWVALRWEGPTRPPSAPDASDAPALETVREGRDLAELWAHEREMDELQRALEVLFEHPNPGERLDGFLARESGRVVGTALVYQRDGIAGIHAVTTQPASRGRGIATRLVVGALTDCAARGVRRAVLLSAQPRLADRLAAWGFVETGRMVEYRLPGDAGLVIPSPGPPAPPRWRPPRKDGATGGPPAGGPRA